MNYADQVEKMLEHFDTERSPDKAYEINVAFAQGIAAVIAAGVKNPDTMQEGIEMIAQAIYEMACAMHKELHGEQPSLHTVATVGPMQ